MAESTLQTEFIPLVESSIDSIKKNFPVETDGKILKLNKIWINVNRDPNDFSGQKDIKTKKKSWTVPIYGSLTLSDKETGKVIDKSPRVKLMNLPAPTDRFSYILKGTEYQVPVQLRLRPGIYTRIGRAGNIESKINTARGLNFDINLDPESAKFSIKVGGTHTNIPLYPILKTLGVSDASISQSWGQKVYESNIIPQDKTRKEVLRFYNKLYYGKDPESEEESISSIREYFKENTELDEKTTKFTLGKGYKTLSPEAILRTSQKLLNVNKGVEEPDDRDSLIFKKAMTFDDFIKERLAHPRNIKTLQSQLKHNIDKYENIREIVNTSIFSNPVNSFLTQSQIAVVPTQTNPLGMLEERKKTTLIGEGGIGDEHVITDEARDVHPTWAGFIDPIHTPESLMVGAVNHLTTLADKQGHDLVTTVWDVKSKRQVKVMPDDVYDSYIAMPDQYKPGTGFNKRKVKALFHGKPVEVSSSKIKYAFMRNKQLFDYSSNLVPFLGSMTPVRSSYAARMMSQAIPLKDREPPLVQVESHKGAPESKNTLEKQLGSFFAATSPVSGKISRVTSNYITVKSSNGKNVKVPIYNNFPLNADNFLHSTPIVKAGDTIKKGAVIADTNYTKDGVMSLGINLKTAYLPYKGHNFEDAIVISETAAKKLTSEHMYQFKDNMLDNGVLNKKKFMAHYPMAVTTENAEKLDDEGVIKKGQIVKDGDVVISMMRNLPLTPDDIMVSRLGGSLVSPLKNRSAVWDNPVDGKVVDVIRSGRHIQVNIRTDEPAQVGDKMVGRSANKGVIGKILSVNEMPHDKDGNPIEVMINPLGVPGRMNYGQTMETAASKIAEKSGKPYIVDNFEPVDFTKKIQSELRKSNISDTEDLIDPSSGKILKNVGTGKQYYYKLDHQASKKMTSRFRGPTYTLDMIPAKDKGQSALKVERGVFNALLGHGSRDIIRDLSTYSSEKNDDFWTAVQMGRTLPKPKPSFAFEKFTNKIQGAGINVERRGDFLKLIPFTDKEITGMSSGSLSNVRTVYGHKFQPEVGGLFDPVITGGLEGKRWSHIKLEEPMPNPIFEEAIKKLLNLKTAQYKDIIAGKIYVNNKGEIVEGKSKYTSGKAIKKMLSMIDIDKDLKASRETIKDTTSTQEANRLNRKIKILKALKEENISPQTYILNNLPIVPPIFRPAYPLPSGDIRVSDLNELYKNFGEVNESLKAIKDLSDDHKQKLRSDLYQSLGAIIGIDDPLINRNYKGIIKEIAGSSPKTGYFQTKIFGRYQDIAGRAVAIPGPGLHVDELGVPEKMAWTLYTPFVVKELVKQGHTPLMARKMIEDQTPGAKKALEVAMSERPVLMNRAPTLHKFSIMSFFPKIVQGHTIQAHPLIVKGYNLDFDGDQVNVFMPVTDESRNEAFRMLPSKNLYNPRDMSLMLTPSKEAQVGLFSMTKKGKLTNKSYSNKDKALLDYQHNKININDVVSINRKRTTVGRELVNNSLPADMQDPNMVLTSSSTKKLLSDISKKYPNRYKSVAEKLTHLGNEYSYKTALSFGLDDIVSVDKTKRDAIVSATQAKIDRSNKNSIHDIEKIIGQNEPSLKKLLTKKTNNLWEIHNAGESRASSDVIQQTIATPFILKDIHGKPLPWAIRKSYGEGLDLDDYWMASRGSRKGMIDRTKENQVPGSFSKTLLDTMVNYVITEEDCGTNNGIPMSLNNKEILDRFTAGSVSSKGKSIIPKNSLIDPETLNKLKRHKISQVIVRSPLKCESTNGVCSMCMGLDEHGKKSPLGDSVGSKVGQGTSEPVIQLVLRSFHGGGKVESDKTVVDTFTRVDNLLSMPKNVPDKATLSSTSGVVNRIETSPAGGKNIYVNQIKHFVSPGQDPLVEKGQKVFKGDHISTGVFKPQELLDLKGKDAVQEAITDELFNLYEGGGTYNRRKNLELVTKAITDYSKIIDPGDSPFDVGDLVKYPAIQDWNKNTLTANPVKIPLKDAYGRSLAESIGKYKTGDTIDSDVIEYLKNRAVRKVSVKQQSIESIPTLSGIKKLPTISDDWIERLTFEGLKKSMIEGAETGAVSEIHGYKPYPAIAYGAEFGKAKEGKY